MVKIYSFPEKEEQSTEFKVKINGENAACYKARVSAEPFNQVWPGYQRPIEQTELTSFVSLGADESVKLEVECEYDTKNVCVKPFLKNVKVNADGNKCTFELPGVGQYVLEYGSRHKVLHIFVNPVKDFGVDENDPDVIYFGKGTHYIDAPINLKDNQTLYIDEGAVLYGSVETSDAKNVRILGYGILDNSLFERGKGDPVKFHHCENVYVEGITVRDSSTWTMHMYGCNNCIVDNIKFIGMWRYNSDGCDFTNSTNCVLRNSFLRNYDDCIVVKGLFPNTHLNVQNIFVENCVTWCDWGRNIEIGAETCADTFDMITFRNCDIIHITHIPLDVQHGDRAVITNVLFDDIRIEYDDEYEEAKLQTFKGEVYDHKKMDGIPVISCVNTIRTMYSKDDHTGSVSGVTFKDVKAVNTHGKVPGFWIGEIEGNGVVSDVNIINFTVDGKKMNSLSEARVGITTGDAPEKYASVK